MNGLSKIILIILVIIVLGAGWYFVSPLFLNKEVNEEFPEFSVDLFPTQAELDSMTDEEREKLRVELEEEAAAMPDKVMDEGMPEMEEAEVSQPADGVEPPPAATEPVSLSAGEFMDADSFHQGEGSVTLYQLPDESRIARFEDFRVTNGPDLHVLLVRNSDPQSRSDVGDDYIDLGQLKGNGGNQNYDIPENVDLDEYGSVVIYCVPFHVIFSTATLE